MDISSTYSKGYSSRRSSRRTTQSSAGSSSSRPARESVSREATPDVYSEIIDSPIERLSSRSLPQSLGSIFSGENFRSIEDEQIPSSIFEPTTALPTTSKREKPPSGYPGVYWHERYRRWEAIYRDRGKLKYVGYFNSADEAHQALDKARGPRSSQYQAVNITGVSWNKTTNKWMAKYSHKGSRIHVGSFDSQEEAMQALNEDRRKRNAPEIGTSKYGPQKKYSK